MNGLIFGVCALVTGISASIRLHYTRKRSHEAAYRVAHRARVAAFFASFIGSLLAIPPLAEAVNRLTALNEVSSLGSDLAAVIFWASLQVMIVDWTHSRTYLHTGIAIRILAASGVILALVWQFQRADTAYLDLSTMYARSSEVTLYVMTYAGFTALAGLEISAFSTGLALKTWQQRRAAAAGLSIAAVGGVFGVAYALSEGGYILAFHTGNAWPLSLENTISPALAGLSIICVAVGLALATASYNIPLKKELS
ncbi:hypothetical protein [Streptomyces sp. M54]|uniref:hypothetical protein n=1 Tax=Streptomyces sp. M54 TaxID=2759525 RepID=UPI001A8F6B34|nr:hypothetical protein [Streptomyces sp. M54]QSS91289.1 hypothetical protein H3V39_13200 [Streptomyces sp. M54]